MVGLLELIELDGVDSTQDEVLERLVGAPAGRVVAVSARSQRRGRGRDGRAWNDPPGAAMLLSVGVNDAPSGVLDELPARVAMVLIESVGDDRVAWKAPNDLVARDGGAKLAGILVDVRTVGSRSRIVVGIGMNLTGPAFTAADGRAATTLEALGARHAIMPDARAVAERTAALLTTVRS